MNNDNITDKNQATEETVFEQNTHDTGETNSDNLNKDKTVKETPDEQKPLSKEEIKKQKKERSDKRWNSFFSWIGVICFALILAGALRGFLGEPVRVDGNSMNDTLMNKEIVIATKPKLLIGKLERGDVVICHFPNRNEHTFRIGATLTLKVDTAFMKRLIALPGDSIAIIEGQLYINDKPVQEDYVTHTSTQSYPRRVLGRNEYFVMGDNRANSHDSRSYDVGTITEDMIVGHAKWVIYPFNKIRSID
ncbi:MAG: signal peptidase I [Eubacteriales bacterium]|nr:signal peptidase I [Eubacteriales bacterium]